jgi:aryl-alcohol dehydrogenase-like predicted oxidoreductase
MEYRNLGRPDIQVSALCLGTMTWGEQNTESEAHAQLDAALAAGVNFIDTAEIYPVPPRADTYGDTERIIGTWLKRRPSRDRVVLASKVGGPAGDWMPHLRGGDSRYDRTNIEAALNGSLERLQTDYLDLYQLHWPERKTNFFGQLGYEHQVDEDFTPFAETLGVLERLMESGKVRHVGLSNETPWGVMGFLRAAERLGLPRVVSIQNPYSLLNRSFEVGLAEMAHRESVGLLAYSPLGFGVLSGKYLQGQHPSAGRLTLYPHYERYSNPQSVAATEGYVEIAKRYGLDPAQMALAYVTSRSFVTSTIIGATTPEQLERNLGSSALELSSEVLEAIEAVHTRHPNPAP